MKALGYIGAAAGGAGLVLFPVIGAWLGHGGGWCIVGESGGGCARQWIAALGPMLGLIIAGLAAAQVSTQLSISRQGLDAERREAQVREHYQIRNIYQKMLPAAPIQALWSLDILTADPGLRRRFFDEIYARGGVAAEVLVEARYNGFMSQFENGIAKTISDLSQSMFYIQSLNTMSNNDISRQVVEPVHNQLASLMQSYSDLCASIGAHRSKLARAIADHQMPS